MNKVRSRISVGLPGAALLAVILGAWVHGPIAGRRGSKANGTVAVGPLRGPETVDLGVVKPGPTTANARIENTGRVPVRLSGIQTSCGCVQADFVTEASRTPCSECRLGPGEIATLRLSLRITAKEPRFRTSLSVRTDLPEVPVWRVNVAALVRMGLTTDPGEVTLGRMYVGEVRTVDLVIRDDSNSPPGAPTVTTSDPTLIEVVGVTATTPDSRTGASDQVGTLRLRIHVPAEATELCGRIMITDLKRPEINRQVRVTGAVRPEYESSPNRLRVSRRSSEAGCAFYVRNTDGRPFQLEATNNFPWAVVVDSGSELRKTHLVRVSIGAAACFFLGGRMPTVLEFRARCGGSEPAPIKVPITLSD